MNYHDPFDIYPDDPTEEEIMERLILSLHHHNDVEDNGIEIIGDTL